MTITAGMIEAKGACRDQVALFRQHFPDGAPMTVDAAVSVSSVFDFDWAAKNLLSAEGLKAYRDAKAPLWKAYEDAKAQLLKAYEDAKAPLLNAYRDAEAPLLKAYEDAEAPLWKAYKDAEAPLWKAYEDAKARVFAQIYLSENAA